jgi:cytochrome c
MDNLETNKFAGALFGTLLFVVAMNVIASILFEPKKPAVPGYDLPVPAESAEAASSAPAAPAEPLPVLLAKADPTKGQTAAKKCASCHSFEKGGPNKVGPDLYGVVGRPVASHAGFKYSAALQAKGGNWTFEDLDAFVHSPKTAVPGTAMAFAGIGQAQERADLLAYLRTLSDNPEPLPTAQ